MVMQALAQYATDYDGGPAPLPPLIRATRPELQNRPPSHPPHMTIPHRLSPTSQPDRITAPAIVTRLSALARTPFAIPTK